MTLVEPTVLEPIAKIVLLAGTVLFLMIALYAIIFLYQMSTKRRPWKR